MVRVLILTMLMALLAGCAALFPAPPELQTSPPAPTLPLATFTPTPAAFQAAALPTAAMPPATPAPPPTPLSAFWTLIFPGAEVLRTRDNLAILRQAPGLVRYGVHFQRDPDGARTVSAWLSEDEEALAAVNCGFYWEKDGGYWHLGLLEVNGERLAQVRPRWGAALVVRDNRAEIVRQPKKRIPPMTLGVQGWPTLLWEGEIVAEMKEIDDGSVARRTAVGVDAQGRVLWVVDGVGRTMTGFAERLQQEDMGLIAAVNLDGGASTGLRWREGVAGLQQGVDSLPIPCVVTFAPME